MAKDPTVHASPAALGSRFQVETVSGRMTIATIGDKLTAAGVAAVTAVLSTYLSSTLSAAQLAALKNVTGDAYLVVGACETFVAVAPGTEAALAALVVTAMKTAGNTVAG
jgi:hypothetical protein